MLKTAVMAAMTVCVIEASQLETVNQLDAMNEASW